VIEVALINIMDLVIDSYSYYEKENDIFVHLMFSLAAAILIQVLITLHHFLSFKYESFLFNFDWVQTYIIIIVETEKILFDSKDFEDVKIFIVLFSIIASISILNSKPYHQLFCYISCWIYMTVRFYFLANENITWIRLSVYLLITFVAIFIFSLTF
jgi:hypothetical protein